MFRTAVICATLLGFIAPGVEKVHPPISQGPVAQRPDTSSIEAPAVDTELLQQLRSLQADARVARAQRLLGDRDEEITSLQIRLAEIPTQDYKAPQRAREMRRILGDLGLHDVRQDAAGNVLGVFRGTRGGTAVILSAHMDTVFPELGTIHVQRQGNVLRAPGISDDAAGLAAMVHLVRALRDAKVPLRRDIVLVATVGEEGEGDLRGVKHLFEHEMPPERVHAFLSIDLGAPQQLVNEALGSRRLHATVTGPGGHSWGDFGRPNPIHALARGLDAFLEAPKSDVARSSYNVGTIEGGEGVNVIPEKASLRVDLRSESPRALAQLERSFRQSLEKGLQREQTWSSTQDTLQLIVQVIGDRPVGATAPEAPLVRTLVAAFAAQGLPAQLGNSSTDANIPMSLGVPSLALPHGARAHDVHSHKEWCDVTGRPAVLAAELVALVALAELDGTPQPGKAPTD